MLRIKNNIPQRINEFQKQLSVLNEGITKLRKEIGHNKLLREYYRIFSPYYDNHMEKTNHFPTIRKILDFIKNDIGNTLMDISCGTGEPLNFLADFLNEKNITVTANDLTPEMLEVARVKLDGKIKLLIFSENDFTELAKIGNKFETILCTQTFHFISEPKIRYLKAIFKMLKKGGTFISIEEWPFLFSNNSNLPFLISILAQNTMVPVPVSTLEILASISGLTLIRGVEERIDNKHMMYGKVYKKT